jgi:hypothetical protein
MKNYLIALLGSLLIASTALGQRAHLNTVGSLPQSDYVWLYCVVRGTDQDDDSDHRYFSKTYFAELGQRTDEQIIDNAERSFRKWISGQNILITQGIAACYGFATMDEAKSDRQSLIDNSKGEDVMGTFFPSLAPLKKHKAN